MADNSAHSRGPAGTKSVDAEPESFAKTSHDFRTPLNIIIGFTQLMLDEVPGEINDEQRRSLNDILDSAQRLLKLVNGILE